MKRLIAIALCVLMLASLSACGQHDHDHDHSVPPIGDTSLTPVAQDATGSVFIGTWDVSAKNSIMEKITYLENGSLQVFFDTSRLGGVFFDDGSKITMYISQKVIEGTYTVDGDVITIIAEDDVLVLTKA